MSRWKPPAEYLIVKPKRGPSRIMRGDRQAWWYDGLEILSRHPTHEDALNTMAAKSRAREATRQAKRDEVAKQNLDKRLARNIEVRRRFIAAAFVKWAEANGLL